MQSTILENNSLGLTFDYAANKVQALLALFKKIKGSRIRCFLYTSKINELLPLTGTMIPSKPMTVLQGKVLRKLLISARTAT